MNSVTDTRRRVFKYLSGKKYSYLENKNVLTFVLKDEIHGNSSLILLIACRLSSDRSLAEPLIAKYSDQA